MAAKEEPENNSSEEEGGKKGKKNRKRKSLGKINNNILYTVVDNNKFNCKLDTSVTASPVPCKQPRYELTREQKQMIKADSVNKKVWDEVLATLKAQGSVRIFKIP